MVYTDDFNVSSLYSLPPDFVRHENEDIHDHAYDFDGQEVAVRETVVQRIVHKLDDLIHH